LIPPETPSANAVSHHDTALAFQLRRSLFRTLNQSLREGSGLATAGSLQHARNALRANVIVVALRHIDRAWRNRRADDAILASTYGRLLVLEGRDYYAALGLLQRAADLAPDSEVAALIVLSLLRLQRLEDARGHFEAAVAAYCVEPGGLLFHIAGEAMRHPGIGAPGWVGRGPNLELVGELSSDEPSNVLDIRIDGQAGFSQMLRRIANPESRRAFSFASPKLSLHAQLEVRSRDRPLLGSGLRVPPSFALDGRAGSRGNWLSGWARIGWAPTSRVRLRIEDEDDRRITAMTGGGLLGQGSSFRINMRAAGLRGSCIRISAQLPDGCWQPLPDSPLLLPLALFSGGQKPQPLRAWGTNPKRPRLRSPTDARAPHTDVIIPVYRGREETLACIDSVLATVGRDVRIIAVDDATDDPMLAGALDALAADGRITLLRNTENLGFVASVNRALALSTTHDAVLLNSDTLVFDDWLPRLQMAAYSGPAVGTVTPLSNSGSIASYPRALGAEVSSEDAAALHALAASTHPGIVVEIPVGVGFCLFVRRDCLRDVGNLDAAVFGTGYGEEVDFCLRARRRGWSHQLAADVYVYHAGGLSFGRRRAALLDRSRRLINLRYPGYDRFIASFLAKNPLQGVRRRFDEHRLSAFQGRFVLLVTLAMSGGVERFVAERCRDLRAQGLYPLLLRPAESGDARHCELWTDAIDLPNLRYDIPKDLGALAAILGVLRLDGIELQHFLHLDARVIDLVRALSIPYDVQVHDYAWICPRVTLIDGSGRYCGEPAVTVCQACVRKNGSNLGEVISVPALRARSDRWLRGARRVMAPSPDAAARLRRHFSDLNVHVQPHSAPVAKTQLALQNRHSKITRVAVIGAIGDHKGYQVLLRCARDARARRLPLEFIVVGYTSNDSRLIATGKVFITGRYSEAEVPHLLSRERPDIAWLPSVWPETWCYTLDHALAAGLPVVAFELGAIAERLRDAGSGLLLPLGLTPRQVNEHLLDLGRASQNSVVAPRSVQSRLSRQRDDAKMGVRWFGTKMNNTSDGKKAHEAQDPGMSASVQVLPLPEGLYLFSVKAASPAPPRANGELTLPAVHVGLGPGVRPEQVEFIAGPNTHGAWLFAQGDLLVTKVIGTGATLVMTSVRAEGGEVLSIKVERLESRASAAFEEQGADADIGQQTTSQPKPKRTGKFLPKDPAKPTVAPATDHLHLPVQIGAHIRARGDMMFADVPWAGRVAPGLWIEAFSVRPLDHFGAQDIEYKGLTGSGFETPWLSDEKLCGTKGMAVPLVGFAVRLKDRPTTEGYDCEYSGYFQSGVTVGPLRNGAPCRSTVANDPLEGIQVRLTKRSFAAPNVGVVESATPVKGTKSTDRGSLDQDNNARSTRRQSIRRP
jgi:GT2 family glycosyltransferase/glycosyltransferase involved in cell wall biosynthesis